MMEQMQKPAAQTLDAMPMTFNFILNKSTVGMIGYFWTECPTGAQDPYGHSS
jgi:hypothetical protein